MKSHRRNEDDENDRPRRRTRRKDDGVPVRSRRSSGKNRSALPLILGLIGGVILFCGGIGTLGYFVVLAPRLDVAGRADRDNKKQEAEGKVTRTKLNQLHAGMNKAQVEAVMGPGRLADHGSVFFATGQSNDPHEAALRWQSARERNLVYLWEEYTDRILVAYSKDPGGTVVGILGSIDTTRTYAEPVRLNVAMAR